MTHSTLDLARGHNWTVYPHRNMVQGYNTLPPSHHAASQLTAENANMDIDGRPRQDSDVSVASTRERNSIASQTSLPSIAEGFPQIKDSPPRPQSRTLKAVAPKGFYPPDNTIIKLDGRALREYIIDGVSFTMQEGRNETVARVERFTADKRRLLYELNVIQQPIRARACGSGPRCEQYPPSLMTTY